MLQLTVNTIALGAAYALVTMGFVLILNATNAVNFSHGALVMLGSYAAFSIGSVLHVKGIFILPLVIVIAAGIGFVLALVAYFPLKDKPVVAVFISTICAGAIFENGVLLAYGPEPRATPPISGTRLLGTSGFAVSEQAIAVIAVAFLLILAQYLIFARTRLGKRLRAVAQDPDMAAACGVNVNAMIALTFMLSSALAGAAGMFLSATYYASPTDGANYTMKAYIAATIGGWGSIPGALIGALLVASFEVIIPALPALAPVITRIIPAADVAFSSTSSTILLFAVFLAVLLWRPQGLMGEAIKVRA